MGARKENRDRKAAEQFSNDHANEPCGLSRRAFSDYCTQTGNEILMLREQVKNDLQNLNDLQKARKLIERQRALIACYQDEQKNMISHGNGILKMLSRFMPVPFWAWSFENKREI